MSDSIDYGNLMHDAMRGLIREVLSQVADEGLPAEHHFFITFDTTHEDVALADWLRQRYPGEMTVVVQHWFENLEVGDNGFGITLNFGDSPEPIYIPYDAISTFVDPSVEFGLRFETQDSDEDEGAEEEAPPEPDVEGATASEAEVVSLDSFRKH
ncbi:SspB family protein [Actibacterium pelagium]|nr:ClpXP protease specificity-enhancing factor SspB [Actibacterium pelagium]